MNYYLVDYENIHNDLDNLINNTSNGDSIVLFYSETCKNISLDVISNFTSRNLKIDCFKVITGTKNALDFQLASYLGYLVGENKKAANYYIVSNDKGFDCLCEYWESIGVSVVRICAQTSVVKPVLKQNPPKTKKEVKKNNKVNNDITLEEVKEIVKENSEAEFIVDVLNNSKEKTEVHNKISKHYKDSKKTGILYKKLKPLFKEKKIK
ncbi:MAG: hypothetical protein IKL49_02825 [Lachnospiraceae bacterium]|nr:hypothetical protein [Lachnospiraceae bacterium]